MNKQSGFSLIEVMIATVLLAIGLLAVGSGEITILTQGKRSEDRVRAVAAAENMIQLMSRNSGNIDNYGGLTTVGPVIAGPVRQAQFDFNDWKRQMEAVSGATGTITFPNAAQGGIVMSGVRTVQVAIALPGQPAAPPIVLTTTLPCPESIC